MAATEDAHSQLPLARTPPLTGPDSERPVPWLTLPNELKFRVLRHFVPSSVSFTDYYWGPGQAKRRHDNQPWVSRQALASACLVSRQLAAICNPLLYETVVLKNHRELLWLLRSFVRNPRLRAQVRRFAWVFVTTGDAFNDCIFDTGPDMDREVAEVLSIWPSTGRDHMLAEIFHLSTTDLSTVSIRKALGLVLAMLPRIKALSLTHGGFPLDFMGLNHNTGHHPVTRLLSPTLQSLTGLEEITVDLASTPWTMWFVIQNAPDLRRVELKGPVSFDAMRNPRAVGHNEHFHKPQELLSLPWTVAKTVRELLLYRTSTVQWDVLPKIFPNLEKLVVVFENDAWRGEFWSVLPHLWEMEKLPEELGHFIARQKSSLRSLMVTGFLSVNDYLTRGGYRDEFAPGHLSLVAPIPPLLSPGLPEVPLVELTADCVWLFGREKPAVAYQIASLLPESLVSLHLIDYWAVSMWEEGVKLEGKPLSYYPDFPSGLNALDFLDNVFTILRDSCAGQHHRLRHITFSSPMFDEEEGEEEQRWTVPATRAMNRAEVQAWQARLDNTFARIGVSFSFTTMRQLEADVTSSWERL